MLMAAMLIVSSLTVNASAAWYDTPIRYVQTHGYMGGTGTNNFEPNGIVTRAQLAQVLFNLSGKPEAEIENPFVDMENHWAKEAVTWAYGAGITDGTSYNQFSPDIRLTREQAATMFCRYWQKETLAAYQPDEQVLDEFIDQGQVSAWARDSICWAVDIGLLHGTSSYSLTPKGNCTRAQLAQLIQNYCDNVATYSKPYMPLGSTMDEDGHVYTKYGTDITGADGMATELEQAIINQINEYRSQCSKPSLKNNTRAQLAAEIRAREVIPCYTYWKEKNVPSWFPEDYRRTVIHARFPWRPFEEFSDMEDYKAYLSSVWSGTWTVYADVSPIECDRQYIMRVAECALCSWNRNQQSLEERADRYVQSWINSEGHRLNLIVDKVSYIGVGVAYDEEHDFYTCVYQAY